MKPFLLSLIITACVAIGVLLWLNPEIRDRITDNWTDRSSPQPDDVKTEEAVPEQREIPPPVRWTGPVGEWTFPGDDALVPFRSSWIYPQILNWRPADGLVSELNPPRFSWPYLQEIVAPGRNQIPRNYFSFQIADNPEFEAPVLDVENTPYNFYNAVPALAPGEWFWRVGYGLTPEVSWSETKSFTVSPEAKVWDRTVIHDAAKILAQRARPRSGPADGDWAALNNRLQNDPRTADQYRGIMTVADRALTLPWWDNMPESDARPPEGFTTRNQREGTIRMLKNAVMVAYAYRLTGDERYSGAMSRILKMASWPRGGGLSPELLGGETKMPSQAAELFAVAYDWFAKDLRPAEARVLREAVAWRLRDMYLDPGSIIWHYGEDGMRDYGLSYFAGSHPYQNFVWTVPATLLMAGDLDIADQLLPLTLHYLTGVTLPDGPEEGYNEGHGYSNEKGGTLLFAALVTDMLLPELEIGKNPVIENFGNWLVYLFPGVERLPWGDSFMSSTRGIGGDNLRMVTYLTGSPLANAIWRQRGFDVAVRNVGTLFSRPWFEMAAYVHYEDRVAAIPEAEKERTLFLPEAGWAFTQSQPIFNHSDFRQSIGMQFQMRPRGGYGHSFASDGSFIWYAHGELLSSGGGWTHWASFHHARSPISHNTLLIDGKGHSSVNPYSPAVPYVARPLAFQETESHTY